MIEMRKILNTLAKRFPKKLAVKYHDHVGLMTGKMPGKVNKILLCLDLDWENFPIIEKNRPDVIITHHPFIFGTKSKVFKWDQYKKELCEKIDALGIPVYSFHTNFDEGNGGMNDALASLLSLNNVYSNPYDPIMRIGYLPDEMEVHEFAKYAKEKLGVNYGLLINYGKEKVKKVGIVGGGGSRDYIHAIKEECDIYISGDAPHYVRRDVVTRKFNYLDFPHEIEKVFMPTMKDILHSIDSNLEIIIVDHEKIPEVI
mgnify:CR=1 FL=1